MGMVYLTDHIQRLTYGQINQLYPDLIPRLVKNEGVGFILVDCDEYGPMVIGNKGLLFKKW